MEKLETSPDKKSPTFLNLLMILGFVSIVLTMLISTLALVGWFFNISQLKYIVPTSRPMYPTTAVGLLFCSLALLLLNVKTNKNLTFLLARLLSLITFFIGTFTLFEYVLGDVLQIDLANLGLIYWVPYDPAKHFQPSPETAICLSLSSLAILFLNTSSNRLRIISETSVLISGGIALLSIAGFITGANNLYSLILSSQAIGMALQTAVSFVLLALGTLCFMPKTGILAVFFNETLGGIVARKLVIIILFAPMGVEFIASLLIRAGLVHPTFKASLVIVILFSIFIFLSWVTARKLDSIDTERKKFQSKLEESENKYRSLIELAPESIFIADQNGKYVEANQAACILLKRTKEEIVGKTILDLIPPEEKEKLEKSKNYQQLSGQTDVLEWKLKKGDGSFVEVEVSAKILSPNRWIAFVRNIEERKKVERRDRILALVAQEVPAFLDMRSCLVKSAKLITDEFGDWCSVNLINEDSHIEQLIVYHRNPDKLQFTKELNNLPNTSTISNRIRSIVANKEGILITKKDLSSFSDEDLQSKRHKLYERLGLLSVCHIPLIARGRAFGLFTIVNAERDYGQEDLTLIKLVVEQIARLADNAYLYQEAVNAKQTREDLMAILSHDLRNPLTVIDLGLQSLKKVAAYEQSIDNIKEAIIKTTRRMNNSVRRSLGLISDLLTFSKIESGGLVLDKTEIHLSSLIEEVIEEHRLIAQAKGIQLSSLVEDPSLEIKADQSKILQVLANLMGNALKFTESGGTIQIKISSKSKEEILFQISDTGSGIKEEEIQQIFKRYWQPKRTQGQGAGLGLAIVKGIIEAHGGRIWVESTFGKGSTFFFTIPVENKFTVLRSIHGNVNLEPNIESHR